MMKKEDTLRASAWHDRAKAGMKDEIAPVLLVLKINGFGSIHGHRIYAYSGINVNNER